MNTFHDIAMPSSDVLYLPVETWFVICDFDDGVKDTRKDIIMHVHIPYTLAPS